MSRADAIVAELSSRFHGRVGRDVSLAPFTTYQLGGPAAVYAQPESHDDLIAIAEVLRNDPMHMLIVGRGSNMLVSDRGFDGIAVRLGAGFRSAAVNGSVIEAGGAMPVPALSALAARHDLSGFEFAVAIPASFGGAIAMNAGAHGRSVGEVVTEALVFEFDLARSRRIAAAEIGFEYRRSGLPARSVVIGGTLGLAPGENDRIREGMAEARSWRRSTQPLGLPNAGSVFKNPPEEAAGRLVERIVGKGARVGGAHVSEVHANFIVADPGASAADVHSLIRRIQDAVAENAGVKLETEVKLVGDFDE